jgi:predicted component of type VI protein secretion system
MNAKKLLILAIGLVLVLAGIACTRKGVDQPSPVGPSTLATVLKVSASPNVISAGTQRAGTTISASLKRFDGTPLADRTVYFEIRDAAFNRVYIGNFEGQTSDLSKQTDSGGNVTFVYYGPLESEIEASTSVYIWAKAAAEGNEFIEDSAQIDIIRGSSSLAAVLKVSASPNVIAAGANRQSTTVTASLTRLDGTPLADRAVYFEIGDSAHTPVYIGYFEGQTSVISKQTNAQGIINLVYTGPLSSEITASTSVYIWAKAASEGIEFVENFAQIDIIRDSSSLAAVLKVSASPNVIAAGANRQSTTVTASLTRLDGTPLAGRTVYFDIGDSAHAPLYIGYFEGQTSVLSRQTDAQGNINLIYTGPLASEITASTSVYIWAKVASEGIEFVENFAQIDIIRDSSSLATVLELSADPNILNAGTKRESATIVATIKRLDGAPLANRTVYFEINDDTDKRVWVGYFDGQNPVATRVTDSEGKAYVTYFAPIKSEIGRSCVLHIWASTPGEGTPFIQTFVEVYIIR